MATYESFKVANGSVSLHIGHWPGRGKKVLCVHGLTANHLCFTPLALLLQKAGFDVLAFDLRGRGKSAKKYSEAGIAAHAGDVGAILEKYRPGEKSILIGHSLGAMICIRYALRNIANIERMVFLDGGGLLSLGEKLKVVEMLKDSLARLGKIFPGKNEYVKLIRSTPVIRTWSSSVEDFLKYEIEKVDGGGVRCNIPPEVIEADMREMGGSMNTAAMFKNFLVHPLNVVNKLRAANDIPFENITCPVLVLKAGDFNMKPGDDLLPVRSMNEMAARLPFCEAHVISGVNHYGILLEDMPERDNLILNFLKPQPKKRGKK